MRTREGSLPHDLQSKSLVLPRVHSTVYFGFAQIYWLKLGDQVQEPGTKLFSCKKRSALIGTSLRLSLSHSLTLSKGGPRNWRCSVITLFLSFQPCKRMVRGELGKGRQDNSLPPPPLDERRERGLDLGDRQDRQWDLSSLLSSVLYYYCPLSPVSHPRRPPDLTRSKNGSLEIANSLRKANFSHRKL